MTTQELTISNFEDTVSAEGIVLVDFWADWCGPCKAFAPVFEQSSETHGDVVFAKVDTEANQELAGGMQITSIPTLMAFRDGVLVFSQAGALPAPALEDLISQVRGLDMSEVHAAIAAAKAEAQAEGAEARRARQGRSPTPGAANASS
jgi:thioredoxin